MSNESPGSLANGDCPGKNKQVVAVFDFDGTLTLVDSFLPFLRQVTGRRRFWFLLFCSSWDLVALVTCRISSHEGKQRLVTRFLGGRSESELQRACETYSNSKLNSLLNKSAMERLSWHQSQKHLVILLSASIENYLIPWARQQSIPMVIGTRLEIENERITGKLSTPNCKGLEKVIRLQKAMPELSQFEVYSYGDSDADRRLAPISDHFLFRSFDTSTGLARKFQLYKILLTHLI
ncbi:MAG: HAD-superfamily hydrolase [Verrucomicrobiales bacterium]|nr:HAD-superfamily hydrolase [Verrucomicrobiales bacterium]MDB6130734.1 HAD-superfamily hydrolase [Verrucomicrobiales bacterium]